MKDAYIIFKNQFLQDKKDAADAIGEFCRQHDLEYSFPNGPDYGLIYIDGEEYAVIIKEEQEETSVCCIIYCLLTKHLHLFRNLLSGSTIITSTAP